MGIIKLAAGAQYSHNVKISDADYEAIVDLLCYSTLPQKDIAKKFRVGEDTISEINTGKSRHCDDFIYPLRDNHKKNFCVDCGAEIWCGSQRCIQCNNILQRKTDRPTREELKKQIRTTTFVKIGQSYGVTDNAVRKWCKIYKLPFLKKDIKTYSDIEWDNI